jgi:beta-N-acetylhexosaminidase
MYSNNIGRAAVDSFKAGNDMLIIPADLDASYRAMVQAVQSGEIPISRVDDAVLKILKAKASVGLNKARLVDVSQLETIVGAPQNLATGQQIADDALTLVRENGKVLPLKHQGTVSPSLPYQSVPETENHLVVVIFSDDVRTEMGRELEKQVLARVPDAHIFYVDGRIASAMSNDVLHAVDEAQTVIAAVFAVPVAGRAIKTATGLSNSVSLPDASRALLSGILEHAAPRTMVLAMGNPYLAQEFPAIENYLCAFSNVSVAEVAVAKALFSEVPIHGRLPVNIPGVATRGTGMERPAQVSDGGIRNASSKSSGR